MRRDLTPPSNRPRVQMALHLPRLPIRLACPQTRRGRMSTLVESSTRVDEVVSRLLNEAKEQELIDRRSAPRHPFFQPATLTYRYRPEEPISVFTREISTIGIGLLHSG